MRLVLVQLLAALACVSAFSTVPSSRFNAARAASAWSLPTGVRGHAPVMALKGLAKKAKIAEVAKAKADLEASSPHSAVLEYLKQGQEGAAAKARPSVVTPVLRKMPGTLSVVAEYRRNLRSGFIASILEPELLSPMFRDGGASAVAIALDRNSGGCTDADVAAVIKEQSIAIGDFPGALPVITRDLVVDEFQVAHAKNLGAIGVTISMGLVGPERAAELVDFTGALDMEAIVQVTNQEEVEAALQLGATILSVTGNPPDEACELKKHIPDSVLAIVHVDRRSDEGLDEIEDCWILRDSGYNCIWASEMLYKAGQMQAESVIAVIKAIRAKASVKYGRARGMSGRGEGAKEFLATLAT
eukprot:TRINITY_DN267_c0_g1_i1.p1 TRINITY_DN267_c0_g1~~TRINITY_DN267_c0_g1_i1.p1  ORF type:complete len:358 (-),score=97.98 TRINITY_DN267_c0_g1_i1:206-1279(-)